MKNYTFRFRIFLYSLFTVCCLLAGPVNAASTITVDTTSDVIGDDGFCSLREAVIAANNDAAFHECAAGSGDDTIQFDPSLPKPATFVLTISGKNENAALTGDLDLAGTVTINGDGQSNTLIDGDNIDRVLQVHPAARVTVNGVTIKNGNPGAANGGGMVVEETGRLTVTSSTIISNTAVLGGGVHSFGRLTMNDSTVKANQGGGLHNDAGLLTLGNVDILNNMGGFGITNEQLGFLQYTNGEVSENNAGGIQNDTATAELSGLTIDLNTGGGGLHNKGVQKSTLTVTNSWIHHNGGSNGAGLYNDGAAASATVENSRINNNTASAVGGGIGNTGILLLKSSTVDNNQAKTGGGIDHQGVSFQAENVTISGNTATDNGGGIANQTSSTLTNVTISGNGASGAGTGGNIYNDGDNPQIIFVNSIVANPGAGGNCVNTVGALNSQGHNLESTDSCNFTAAGDMINADPLLGPLQNNGGPTPTHALQNGSPAIDKGDDAKCPTYDQRGVARPVGPSCDIGSVEANGVTPDYGVDLSPDDAKSGVNGESVTYMLILANNGNVTDTFDLTVSGNSWQTELSDDNVTLPAGQTSNIMATVTIPADEPGNASDMATITAVSQGDPSKDDVATLSTTVTAIYGVSLSSDEAQSAEPGEIVTYTLTLTNSGNLSDSFNLALSGNNWPSALSDTNVPLGSGKSTMVTVEVEIPPNAAVGQVDVVSVSAASQADSNKSATTQLTTTSIKIMDIYLPVVASAGG